MLEREKKRKIFTISATHFSCFFIGFISKCSWHFEMQQFMAYNLQTIKFFFFIFNSYVFIVSNSDVKCFVFVFVFDNVCVGFNRPESALMCKEKSQMKLNEMKLFFFVSKQQFICIKNNLSISRLCWGQSFTHFAHNAHTSRMINR